MTGDPRRLLFAAVAVFLGTALVPLVASAGEKESIYFKGKVCRFPYRAPDVTVLLPQAEAGDPEAQYQLASRYRSGLGATRDDDKAAKWMRRAAKQGHSGAQSGLAGMYFQAIGVKRNVQKALFWLRRAGRKGNACAQAVLGDALLFGTNEVPVDPRQAAKWLHLAAEQKSGRAHRLLAFYYYDGYGNAPDKVKALKWAIVSEAYNPTSKQVREFREKLEKKIPAAEAAEGRRRAAAWFAAHPD